MKRFVSLVLSALCVFGVTAFASTDIEASAASGYEPGDIAAVYIETENSVNPDYYVGCTIRIVDKEGGEYAELYDSAASIKIRGNSTSSGAKKPYNFKFSSKTNVFGMGKAKKWCLLANCYEKTLIRNEMVFDFARQTVLRYTPDSVYVDVYFNGVLSGNYILCEAVEDGSSRVDIDTDANEFLLERDVRTDEGTYYFNTPYYGIRFGLNAPETPTSGQIEWLNGFLYDAEMALHYRDFNSIDDYFDIPSMVDFYIILEYFKQVDVSVGSTRFYIKDGKIYGGPVWDFDLTMGNCLSSYYQAYNNVGGSGKSCESIYCAVDWYSKLLDVPEFLSRVKERYLELQNIILNLYADTLSGTNYIDRTIAENSASFGRNYSEAGWKIGVTYSDLERIPENTYEGNVEYLRTWLRERNDWLLGHWGITARAYPSPSASSGLTVSGGFIYGLGADRTPSEVSAMFGSNAVITCGKYVGTGSTVSVGGADYAFVVIGDVNGNGSIDAGDYIMTKRAFVGTYSLTPIMLAAADCDGSGSVSAADYLMIKRHFLGSYNLYN